MMMMPGVYSDRYCSHYLKVFCNIKEYFDIDKKKHAKNHISHPKL
jgi:hypothetical protein